MILRHEDSTTQIHKWEEALPLLVWVGCEVAFLDITFTSYS